MNKIILCYEGNSEDVDEWSNIPYMLLTTLQNKGVEVIKVNTTPNKYIKFIWKYSVGIIHKIINFRTSYDYYRSYTNYVLTTIKMNYEVEKYKKEAIAIINLSISHSPTSKKIPIILLSDWSYDFYIKKFLKREPDWSEKKTIERDLSVVKRADLNILLFPQSAYRLKQEIPDGNFKYISHVVNVHPDAKKPTLDSKSGNLAKISNKGKVRLLFIGRSKYKKGLKILEELNINFKKTQSCHIDVVGMTREELEGKMILDNNIEFHGYLSKGNEREREKYYEILDKADIMLNLTESWGPFSASLEAMYYYTMIVTPKYDEFIEIFGQKPSFAEYLDKLETCEVQKIIEKMIENPNELKKKKIESRIASENHLWSNFVGEILTLCEELRKKN